MNTKGNFWSKKYLLIFSLPSIIGLVVGALLSYIYYLNVGCEDGCTIRSNPYYSTMWGAAVGYLLGDLFSKKSKQNNIEKND